MPPCQIAAVLWPAKTYSATIAVPSRETDAWPDAGPRISTPPSRVQRNVIGAEDLRADEHGAVRAHAEHVRVERDLPPSSVGGSVAYAEVVESKAHAAATARRVVRV